MTCRHCGKSISILRRLSDAEFCSPEHRRMFTEMQQHLAFARLLEAQQKLSAMPKPPLKEKPAEPPAEEAFGPTRLGPFLPHWPEPHSPSGVVLRASSEAWPVSHVAVPRANLEFQGYWAMAEEVLRALDVEPSAPAAVAESVHEPQVWAQLTRLPFFEPRLAKELPISAEQLAWPFHPLPLNALYQAIEVAEPHMAGLIDARPNFLELCLSFLQVAGAPAPQWRRIIPEIAEFSPAVPRWPVFASSFTDTLPAVPEEVAPDAAAGEAVAPVETKVVEAVQVEPAAEEPLVIHFEPVALAPVAEPPRAEAAAEAIPATLLDAEPLSLEFEEPVARPMLVRSELRPLMASISGIQPTRLAGWTAHAVPKPSDEVDLPFAEAVPEGVREPQFQSVAFPRHEEEPTPSELSISIWRGATAVAPAAALGEAGCREFPLSLSPLLVAQPQGEITSLPVPVSLVRTPGLPAAAPERGSHQTSLLPHVSPSPVAGTISFNRKAESISFASRPSRQRTPFVAGGSTLLPVVGLSPISAGPALTWESGRWAAQLSDTAIPSETFATATRIPSWSHRVSAGLAAPGLLPVKVRILARRSKV